jgi:hypothetical protein
MASGLMVIGWFVAAFLQMTTLRKNQSKYVLGQKCLHFFPIGESVITVVFENPWTICRIPRRLFNGRKANR